MSERSSLFDRLAFIGIRLAMKTRALRVHAIRLRLGTYSSWCLAKTWWGAHHKALVHFARILLICVRARNACTNYVIKFHNFLLVLISLLHSLKIYHILALGHRHWDGVVAASPRSCVRNLHFSGYAFLIFVGRLIHARHRVVFV